MGKYQISWSGGAPLAMSLAVLLLILVGDRIFGVNPLPIHDEDTLDHIGMILIYGQVPLIAYFALCGRRQLKRTLPVLVLQLSLLTIIFAVVYRHDQSDKQRVARRIENNTPIPGSEIALSRSIQSQQRGHPDYNSMSSTVARYVGQSLALTRAELQSLGPLQSLAFKGVDRLGWDIYDVHFANGDQKWRIFTTSNGVVFGLTRADSKYGCRSSEVYECR